MLMLQCQAAASGNSRSQATSLDSGPIYSRAIAINGISRKMIIATSKKVQNLDYQATGTGTYPRLLSGRADRGAKLSERG